MASQAKVVCFGSARRLAYAVVTTVLLVAGGLAFVPQAQAYIYWSSSTAGSLGRANLDKSAANQSFLTGAAGPAGIAVDAHHIYWANLSGASIGRADINGTGANQSFIAGAGAPTAVAVDDKHVYWAAGTTIGRANLDGTGADAAFITGLGDATGVAVNGGFVYWTDSNTAAIGRAKADGSGVQKIFIGTPPSTLGGIAVGHGYIYWTNTGDGTIGKATTAGNQEDPNFIHGASSPTAIAVDQAYIYWVNSGTGAIARADLSGHNVHERWLGGVDGLAGLAADYLPKTVAKCFAALRPVVRNMTRSRAAEQKAKTLAETGFGNEATAVPAGVTTDLKKALALEAKAKRGVTAAKHACVGPGGPRITRSLTSLFAGAGKKVVRPLKALLQQIAQATADHKVFQAFPPDWTHEIESADRAMARLASRVTYIGSGAGFPPTASP